MATGDGTAFVLINHPDVARSEVTAVLRKRWPEVAVVDVDALGPCWSISTEAAAELARIRRGIEPLRAVVLPQRKTDPAAMAVEPMPIVF